MDAALTHGPAPCVRNLRGYLGVMVAIAFVPALSGCGPGRADLAELVAHDQPNLTGIRVTGMAREDGNWIRARGTARLAEDVYKPLSSAEIDEECELAAGTANRALRDGRLDRVAFVTRSLSAGTPVRFDIGMAPDRAGPEADPEAVTGGGWTNGAWDPHVLIDGQRVSVFRTRDWWREKRLVESGTPEAVFFCAMLGAGE